MNPLEAVPEACHQDRRLAHVQPTRQKWFGCACCPPNIARLVSSVQAYAYTVSEEVLYTHLYMGSELAVSAGEKDLRLRTETDMPWGGHFRMEIGMAAERDTQQNGTGDEKADSAAADIDECKGFYTFAFRLPGWSEKTEVRVCRGGEYYALEIYGDTMYHLTVEGDKGLVAKEHCSAEAFQTAEKKEYSPIVFFIKAEVKDEYLYLSGDWRDSDCVTLDFTMETHMVTANPRVREDVGKVAFLRGPLTYCMEEADNGANLHLYCADLNRIGAHCQGIKTRMTEIQGHKISVLEVPGLRMKEYCGTENLSAEKQPLYRDYQPPTEERVSVTLIPYYVWANRGEGEMSVWVRVKKAQ